MQRLGSRHAPGGRFHHRALRDVPHLQHPLRAEKLDPLVVAVGGAARIADHRDAPVPPGHRHGSGIHVSRRPDGRVDEGTRGGEHGPGQIAHDEVRQVEVVDHHVPEQPAGDRDVGEGRRRGIEGCDRQEFGLADLPLPERPSQGSEARVEATVEADHHRPAGLRHRRAACPRPLQRQVHGLLAQDGLARRRRGLHQVGMGVRRGGDQHRVDGRVGDDRLRRARLAAVSRGERFGIPGHVVRHGGEPAARMRGDNGGMDGTDPTRAQESDLNHVVPLPNRRLVRIIVFERIRTTMAVPVRVPAVDADDPFSAIASVFGWCAANIFRWCCISSFSL